MFPRTVTLHYQSLVIFKAVFSIYENEGFYNFLIVALVSNEELSNCPVAKELSSPTGSREFSNWPEFHVCEIKATEHLALRSQSQLIPPQSCLWSCARALAPCRILQVRSVLDALKMRLARLDLQLSRALFRAMLWKRSRHRSRAVLLEQQQATLKIFGELAG